MAQRPAGKQERTATTSQNPNRRIDEGLVTEPDDKSSLETCFKVLGGVQEQIRFADAKAAFVFGINALLFGFVANTVSSLNRALSQPAVPILAWIILPAIIMFSIFAALAVLILISVIMSRFGDLAPKSRSFFGHVASHYGKDYAKYVNEIKLMTNATWIEDVGTQIVETSHIALAKHRGVGSAAWFTIIAFAFWLVAVFGSSLIA